MKSNPKSHTRSKQALVPRVELWQEDAEEQLAKLVKAHGTEVGLLRRPWPRAATLRPSPMPSFPCSRLRCTEHQGHPRHSQLGAHMAKGGPRRLSYKRRL